MLNQVLKIEDEEERRRSDVERVQVEIVEGGFENGGLVVVELDHGISSGDHAEERKNHVMALEEHGGQGLGNGEFVLVE